MPLTTGAKGRKSMSARFEHFASGEYIDHHFRELLTSKEMEFLYRLQADEPLRGRNKRRRVTFDTERPWLKQQRRTLDISNLGRQDETWTFEIDWSVVQDIAVDCGLGRFEPGERVPFPLLMIRRYVATDYTCDADSNGTSMYMTHRGANNAFAALMSTYFLSARYQLGNVGKSLPNPQLDETYKGWSAIFSLGGNLPSDRKKTQQENANANAEAFFWHLNDIYFVSRAGVRELEASLPAGEKSSYEGSIDKYYQERYGENRSATEQDEKDKTLGNQLWSSDGPLPTPAPGHDHSCAHSTMDLAAPTTPKELEDAVATTAKYRNLVKKLIDQYPVLVFIPAQESGRRTYQFHLTRYEQRFTVRRAFNEIDERAKTDSAITKWERRRKKFLALLLFREFGQPFQWLRSSTFLVHRFAKDVRPTLVRDTYDGDEQSIVSDTELYTSLHHRPRRQSGVSGTSVTAGGSASGYGDVDGVTDDESVSGLLIPRFRYVIPMLTFFAIQVTLLALYGWLTQFGFAAPPQSNATRLADDTLFRTLVLAQLGVTFFIAPRDESSTATRMLRIPRYTALVLLPFQLWMLNVPYGASLPGPFFGAWQSSGGWRSWIAGFFGVIYPWPWPWALGAVASVLPLLALFLRTVAKSCHKYAIAVLLVLSVFCGGLTTCGHYGPVILPFIAATALSIMLAIWLIAYLYLRFVVPQNLPPQHPQS